MTNTELRTYAARVFRDDHLWVIEIPELDAVSQSRTLASAEEEARALVGVWLDVPVDQVAVHMDYSAVDPDAWRLAAEARTAQAQADELTRRAAATRRQAARHLVRESGLSLRDAAAVLGVTFSRVQQLLKEEVASGSAGSTLRAAPSPPARGGLGQPASRVNRPLPGNPAR